MHEFAEYRHSLKANQPTASLEDRLQERRREHASKTKTDFVFCEPEVLGLFVGHGEWFHELFDKYADLPMPVKSSSTSQESDGAAAATTTLSKIAEEMPEEELPAHPSLCMSFQSFLQVLADYRIFPALIGYRQAQKFYYSSSCSEHISLQPAVTISAAAPSMMSVKDAPVVSALDPTV